MGTTRFRIKQGMISWGLYAPQKRKEKDEMPLLLLFDFMSFHSDSYVTPVACMLNLKLRKLRKPCDGLIQSSDLSTAPPASRNMLFKPFRANVLWGQSRAMMTINAKVLLCWAFRLKFSCYYLFSKPVTKGLLLIVFCRSHTARTKIHTEFDRSLLPHIWACLCTNYKLNCQPEKF